MEYQQFFFSEITFLYFDSLNTGDEYLTFASELKKP